MTSEDLAPLTDVLRWLSAHTGFPAHRLAPKVETLLCVAALSAAEDREEQRRFGLQRRDASQTASLKAHALRRSQVHYKCDNSAKV